MATTVTYKGQTLTTVENETKVLETKGTWVEDDFTLTDVSGGGGEDYLAKSVMNTLTSYESDEVTSLCSSALRDRTRLQSVSLPNCSSSGNSSFMGCTGLVSAYTPNVIDVPTEMFRGCTSLTTYDFSKSRNLNNSSCFYQTKLTGVYAPVAISLGTWGNNHFAECTSLLYFRAPNATGTCRQRCFYGDTALKLVDCAITNFSAGNNFTNCTTLETLILRNTTVANLSNVNEFSNITQNVKVYVPSAIRASYETANNWSTLANNGILTFYDLEGSPYEATDFQYMGVPE